MMSTAAATREPTHFAPLYWLALGTFAVGTEGFMVAGILPAIGRDLNVGVATAGQLVTIFSLVYALSSPILTVLTHHIDRRQLLLLSMAGFTLCNLIAAAAQSYILLAGARVLLACMAGLYTPNANALAGILVPPEKRGRALAIINGGLTTAVALGVPIGAIVGNNLGWRTTFLAVAMLAGLATIGLVIGTRRGLGAGLHTATIRERVMTIREPGAALGLVMTTVWGAGTYSVYTYVSAYLHAVVGLTGAQVSPMLFLWGAGAFVGIFVSGHAVDRLGHRKVHAIMLPIMCLALYSLSITAMVATPHVALFASAIALALWGFSGWGTFPAQQARLIGITGPKGASVILSLNASFMYLGFAMGAAIGSVILSLAGAQNLGWFGGTCILLAILMRFGPREPAPRLPPF